MLDICNETIVAVATPPGEGGVAIVRLSGDISLKILASLVRRAHKSSDEPWKSHHMYFGHIHDDEGVAIDEVLAVFMKAPHSYTGQDCAEIHCHGGRLLPHLILDLCVAQGARLATPGEFTLRAFLMGRLDLSQSEAVLGLIKSGSGEEVRLNAQGLEGALSRRVNKLRARLLDLVARLEAEIDFGEEVDGVTPEEQERCAENVRNDILELLDGARAGELLAHGVSVALVGPPNAGKSTLWNKLLGEERALVTPIPGTTRDRLEAICSVKGSFLRLIDTAGLHESSDYVENLGMERSREALRNAELNVVVLDGSRELAPEVEDIAQLVISRPSLVVLNKRDLGSADISESVSELFKVPKSDILTVSLWDDGDIELLSCEIARRVSSLTQGYTEGALSVNQRQTQALVRALECLKQYAVGVEMMMPSDCLLSDLHRALGYLGEITGENVSEDIIHQVFSKFCLGK